HGEAIAPLILVLVLGCLFVILLVGLHAWALDPPLGRAAMAHHEIFGAERPRLQAHLLGRERVDRGMLWWVRIRTYDPALSWGIIRRKKGRVESKRVSDKSAQSVS